MAGKIEIMETVLRDAHQCLIATRMRTEDMLPIAAALDEVGYWSLETWGGATFDATLRFLKECPWERLRKLRAAMPKTRFQMLLRGQNVVGYRNYPDDVVRAFVDRAAANGIDVFRIFDAMNDVRNMKTAIEAGLKTGKLVEGTVCYTISPVHSADYFLRVAEKLAELGVQIICLKDMGGLLAPYAAYEIIKKIKSRIALPLHLHTHCTAGLAQMTYMMAIEAGVDILDTAISPFSQGTSQPATEQVVAALMGTAHDTGLDLGKLANVAEYFYRIRPNYAEFESPVNNQIKPDVLISQIPGGMLSNLVAQLRQQKAEDKLDLVLAEMPHVRKDLGYPPLVTPTSQMVGAQAALNVMTGKRYSVVNMETRNYVMGLYGEAPGQVSDEMKLKVLGKKEAITCRPADLLKPGLEQARKDSAGMAHSEEDVITYALFPEIAKDFFQFRNAQGEVKQPAAKSQASA
jgi:oxaloacetate decarboxylase (Na+ extruding) subunit alpha